MKEKISKTICKKIGHIGICDPEICDVCGEVLVGDYNSKQVVSKRV